MFTYCSMDWSKHRLLKGIFLTKPRNYAILFGRERKIQQCQWMEKVGSTVTEPECREHRFFNFPPVHWTQVSILAFYAASFITCLHCVTLQIHSMGLH